MSGMSDERLAELRADITQRTWVNGNRLLGEMLDEVDRLRYANERAIELRRQAEATCVRRTAERDSAKRERDDARREVCEGGLLTEQGFAARDWVYLYERGPS